MAELLDPVVYKLRELVAAMYTDGVDATNAILEEMRPEELDAVAHVATQVAVCAKAELDVREV